jgi:transposase
VKLTGSPYLLPPLAEDWLPEDHLACFAVDIVHQLDLTVLTRQYRGTGSAAYHPTVMLDLVICGYATGVFSSRRIEAATHDSIAFRYIAGNEQPDHDSLSTFPQTLSQWNRSIVCASADHCPTDEVAQAGHHRAGRHQGSRQCLAPCGV